MDLLNNIILQDFGLFLLILVRISGIFVTAPIFASRSIPSLAKIGLSAIISFILLPVLGQGIDIEFDNAMQIFIYSINEFLIGMIIGYVAFVYFSTLFLAGTIIDTQMGFGMVTVMDPNMNVQVPVMGNFFNNLVSFIFVVVNGHHLIIRALIGSYDFLPIGFAFSIRTTLVGHLVRMFAQFFMLAVQFSAPVLIAIFLANILLGVLARTMPQMNVFIVGLPLKIAVGMVLSVIIIQHLGHFSEKLFELMFTSIYEMIRLL
ncbi:MAG: flagellar type III secretion system protein FliR [Clostridiales bacterium]|nr:flagellar type III secretion system protein FliR [Clostridiales bacterium]